MQQKMKRRDGSNMTLAQSKRANELQKDMNAWEENRMLTSGVVRMREVSKSFLSHLCLLTCSQVHLTHGSYVAVPTVCYCHVRMPGVSQAPNLLHLSFAHVQCIIMLAVFMGDVIVFAGHLMHSHCSSSGASHRPLCLTKQSSVL